MRPYQLFRRLGGGAGGGGGPYLDSLATTPRAALAIKKLISTATAAIRVRRSNDDAEQDIGFSGDALDTSALASFVGSNSAYVTKVYDQTGNGFDATQTTKANQPRIVNAGTYDGKLVFDGSNDSLTIASLTNGTQNLGVYGRYGLATGSPAKVMFELSPDYNANNNSAVVYWDPSEGGINAGMGNASGGMRNSFNGSGITEVVRTVLLDRGLTSPTAIKGWEAGVSLTPSVRTTATQSGNFNTYDFYIGSRAGSGVFSDLLLQSLVLYAADTSTLRSSIEAML
mgnify:CR=1 FL=1